MSPTNGQLSRGIRQPKKRVTHVAALGGAPHRNGIIYKIAVMSPRKPNSARRTFAKVRLTWNQKKYLQKFLE